MTSRDYDMTSRDSYVLYLFIIWPLCQLVHLKNAAYFYGLSTDCINVKHHKYCQNIRIQGSSIIPKTTNNPILLYTMTISSIPNPNFRFSQSTFYPEMAPVNSGREFFDAKYQFYRKKTYTPDVNFFIAHQKNGHCLCLGIRRWKSKYIG